MRVSSQIISTIPSLLFLLNGSFSLLSEDSTDQFSLKYQFAKGQVIRYEETLRDDYRIQVGENVDTPHAYQTSGKSIWVESVDSDGAAIAVIQMDWVTMNVLENGEKKEYDSRFDAIPDPQFAAVAALLGRPRLRVKITRGGKVLTAETLISGQTNPDPESVEVLEKLPESPLRVGETWKEDYSAPLKIQNGQLVQKVKMQRRYGLKSVENGIATITVKTVVITPVDDPSLQMQLIRRQPEGEYRIDLSSGLLQSFELTQDNDVPNFSKGPSLMTFKQLHTQKLVKTQVAESEGPVTN